MYLLISGILAKFRRSQFLVTTTESVLEAASSRRRGYLRQGYEGVKKACKPVGALK